MYIISKSIKGQEYLYSTKYSILCSSEKQANKLATFLNEHNDTTQGNFKLKDNEVWHMHEIDKYDTPPRYKLTNTKGKISIKEYDPWGKFYNYYW